MLRGRGNSTRGAIRGTPRGTSRGRGRGAPSGVSPQQTSHSNAPDPFEKERTDNASKREQRGGGGTSSTRGSLTPSLKRGGGGRGSKSVSFADIPALSDTTGASDSMSIDLGNAPVSVSPFGTASTATTSSSASNPFSNPFGNSAGAQTTNQPTASITNNPFASKPQQFPSLQSSLGNQAPATSSTSIFGGSTGNPFGSTINSSPQILSSTISTGASPSFASVSTPSNPFGQPLFGGNPPPSGPSTSFFATTDETFNTRASNASSNNSIFGSNSAPSSPFVQKPLPPKHQSQNGARSISSPTKSKLAVEIETLLKRKGIVAPPWPTVSPGDAKYKATIEAFWQTFKVYRAKVRTCLIQNELLDDPEKPKKLSEAIDFKGTCEEMCPEFEKITRIMEHDVREPEKVLAPDGNSFWPSPPRMIKALARSAAGQDAPLPEDVRSPAALRRTLDYLIDQILANKELRQVHGYLWDRTRAIRRDFVFQQASMNSQELLDEVYCLEKITRFHVTALHQMSRQGNATEDFSEQQEVEQLGKALLSLIHAYEDCKAQSISCENEAEFRAYYIVFNSHNPGILEAVQDWGWKFWGESKLIQVAVSLVETLQNVWDSTGPLKPHSPTNIAQNFYGRFFSIINGRDVSYTMACFAEIHFNKVRKAILKSLVMGYRKQRDQAKDWTLSKMNTYLHFDDEDDIVSFGEAYGLHFEDVNGDDVLVIDSDDTMDDPFPPLKQRYSENVVERKRGYHTLAEVIHNTVYQDAPDQRINVGSIQQFTEPKATTSPAQVSSLDGTSSQPTRENAAQGFIGRALQQPDVATTSPSPFAGLFQQFSKPKSPEKGQEASQPVPEPKSTAPFSAPSPFFKPPQPAAAGNLSAPTSSFFPPAHDNVKLATEKKTGTSSSSPFSFLGQNSPTPSSQLYNPAATPVSFFPSLERGNVISATPPPLNATENGSSEEKPDSLPLTSFFPRPQQQSENQRDLSSSTPSSSPLGSTSINVKAPALPSFISKGVTTVESIPVPAENKPAEEPMKLFADWYALAEGGSVDDFTHFTIESILKGAMKQFRTEKKVERKLKKQRLIDEEVVQFRQRSLALKYVYRWRDIVHQNFVKRKGREGREARLRLAAEIHASKVAESQKAIEDFKTSQTSAKREKRSRESISDSHMFGHISLLDPGTASNEAKRRLKSTSSTPETVERLSTKLNHSHKMLMTPPKINGSVRSSESHRRAKSESKPKVSPMCDPHISRIYAFDSWSLEDEMRERSRRTTHVKTDYFRLKARGITTLPDGTPLATSAAVHLPVKPLTQATEIEDASPGRTSKTSVERDMDMESWKARAKQIMAEDDQRRKSQQAKKRHFQDDDDELFAKAKRIREQMDQDSEWLKAEVEKSTMSRSHS